LLKITGLVQANFSKGAACWRSAYRAFWGALSIIAEGRLASPRRGTPDVFRLCSSEFPNVDRIVVCLKREKPNLSKPCQAVMNSPIANAIR
jgi:hypothetical protein